jgi:hypothetical protein
LTEIMKPQVKNHAMNFEALQGRMSAAPRPPAQLLDAGASQPDGSDPTLTTRPGRAVMTATPASEVAPHLD